MMSSVELGLTTFAEITDDRTTPGERLRQVVAEAQFADELGLDVYGVGEHHRPDMVASAPEWFWPRSPAPPSGSS